MSKGFIHKIYIFLFIISFNVCFGQTFEFSQAVTDSLPQVNANSLQVGDVNNDGFNDLFISGYDERRFGLYFDVLIGTELGVLSPLSNLEIITYPDTIGEFMGGLGNIALADVNRDGNIDTYINGSAESYLLLNGSDGFEFTTGLESLSLTYSHGSWGDVNMDGTPDLFMMGVDETQDIILNKLYLNNGDRLVEDFTTIFPNLFNGSSAWCDYDNDGDPDLIICGQTASSASSVTRFYKNEPTGRLVEDTNQDFIGLKAGSFKFSDLDQDGDQDLIMSGWNVLLNSNVTKIYKNEPLGTYTEIESGLDFGVSYGSIESADFDLDGDIDFIIAGADSTENLATDVLRLNATLVQNNGNFSFTVLQNYQDVRIANFIDVNSDLKPDLVTNGTTQFGDINSSFTKVYINQSSSNSSLPIAPSSLTAFAVSNRAIFTWGSGSDESDNSTSLRYNLKIGNTVSRSSLLSPSIIYRGSNVGQRLVREFSNIPHGTYYWSVQTLDAAGNLSEWSDEDTLFISRLVTSTQSLPGVYFSSAGWADYNNDNKLDLALTGITFSGNSITSLYQNEDELLSQDLSQNIDAVFGGHLSWVDYTNDGNLDISLSGFQIINFNGFPATAFYKYQNGTYVFDAQNNVTNSIYGYTMGINGGSNNHSWGDFDNDGDFDFVIGGTDYYGQRNLKIFKNDGGNLSLDTTQLNLIPLFPCMVNWVDLNNDGYLDLVSVGADSNAVIKINTYINDSSYVLNFSDKWSSEQYGVTAGAFDFGDYNDDGLIDFSILGLNSNSEPVCKIITNSIDGFSKEEGHELRGLFNGRPTWGDYDNDGDLDLLISGLSSTADGGRDPFTSIYYQQNSVFSIDETLNIDSLGYSFTQFGDYDDDGDIDLFVSGFNSSSDVVSKVYDNLEALENKNNAPNKPYSLNIDIDKKDIHLSWSAPQDIGTEKGFFTKVSGLKYQIQIGTENTNNHKIITGNYGNNSIGSINLTDKIVRGVPEGNYFWKVRASDHGSRKSDWSNADYFYIDTTPPNVDTVRANYISARDVILVVKFKEQFFLNVNIDPYVFVTHPETPDLDEDGVTDSIVVTKESYNGDEWTGSVSLPTGYNGKTLNINVSSAVDERGNQMIPESIYKTPETVISLSGGTSISEDGNAFLMVPQSAIKTDAEITINNIETSLDLGDSTYQLSNLYNIKPNNLELEKPVVIRIVLGDSLITGLDSIPFIARVEDSGELLSIGGSKVTINNQSFLQVQTDKLGTYGIFAGKINTKIDSLSNDLVCQPRIFSPAGSIFEFNKTNILYTVNPDENQNNITARIFNLSGRLKRVIEPEVSNNISGNQVLAWDGRDFDGKVVKSGLYIVTLEKESTILKTTVGVLNR
jgi:hypothetical protein